MTSACCLREDSLERLFEGLGSLDLEVKEELYLLFNMGKGLHSLFSLQLKIYILYVKVLFQFSVASLMKDKGSRFQKRKEKQRIRIVKEKVKKVTKTKKRQRQH